MHRARLLSPLSSSWSWPSLSSPPRRWMSDRPSFLSTLLKSLREEYGKSDEMQQSLTKFRAEAKKLEESEALKKAREKFESIENTEKSNLFKQHVSGLADKVKTTLDEVANKETVVKAKQSAEAAAKAVGSAAENLGRSDAFRVASSSARTLKEEIEGHALGSDVYNRPLQLRMRKENAKDASDSADEERKRMEPDTESTGVELHKDSRLYQNWQKFKESNPIFNKFVDYRVKYEESDNPVVRSARFISYKLSDAFGTMFSQSELSEVLTEICKMDPDFCKENFLKECENDFIPNIIEAMIRGDLQVLEDWCFEAPFNLIATPIRQARQLGYVYDSKVLDIENVDLAMGKVTEQGPVLVITFTTQQIMCLRNAKGDVVEGDPDKVMRITHVWVMCRDQTELDPKAAWRLLELSQSASEQFF